MDTLPTVANPHLPTGTAVPPLGVLTARNAELAAAVDVEHYTARLIAECRALIALDPWTDMGLVLAVERTERALEAATVAHTHRAAVESEYQRVQQAEDARIGWDIACEGVPA